MRSDNRQMLTLFLISLNNTLSIAIKLYHIFIFDHILITKRKCSDQRAVRLFL